ncbi:MAG: ethanolamine ammonia-lyase reactivating factor EutA [Oscillospiraceae bacterium]|nr:ethanolamine ammonia-lyase reactivating factor EutA [Oscillospiraceae bacterium]
MDRLISVGLDVGTTTTQLILSELMVENRGNAFSVPEMVIGERKIRYQSPVIFTPLLSGELVDGQAIAQWVDAQYLKAGISKAQVDTGAVIITGETSRKENAKEVLAHLAGFAGDFVVATAGPDLESVLSAKGAGAVEYSAKTGRTVLHMDIGGGTSNLSYINNGKIVRTGCLNVGGRLVKFDEAGKVTYLSPVLKGLTDLNIEDIPTASQLKAITDALVQALLMAADLAPATELLEKLTTKETAGAWHRERAEVISFSGGVADCIDTDRSPFAYGDLGVLLGRAIKESALCQGPYRLGEQTIRATVIGAGCHSTQLSGSTVFYADVALPKKNLPVAVLTYPVRPETVQNAYLGQDSETVVLAIPNCPALSYGQVKDLAEALVSGSRGELLVCLQADMAKALGHCIRLLAPNRPCLCIDGLHLEQESFLDIGTPVGPALPVVIKTLVLSTEGTNGTG